MHGFAWYNRFSSKGLRGLICLTTFVIVLGLPVVLVTQISAFMKDVRTAIYVEYYTAETITYPYITICQPKYFDSRLLEKFNISNNLANFMMIALDPNARNYSEFTKRITPPGETQLQIDLYNDQLKRIMKMNNLTDMMDLFQEVAVRCHHFISYCDDHRIFYMGDSQNITEMCCGVLFDPKPFFSTRGACFKMKRRPIETIPSIFSSVIVWLQPSGFKPETSMVWLGSSASDREGAVWTVSDRDHPAQVLMTKGHKIAPGTMATIGLRISQTDRSKIPGKCQQKNEVFEDVYGMPLTKANCQYVFYHHLHPNCSLATYAGLPSPDPRLHSCLPSETLSIKNVSVNTNKCLHNCEQTDYEVAVTASVIHTQPLMKYLKEVNESRDFDPSIGMTLQFHFESFEYEKNILDQENFFDFTSKLGGWMSLGLGASLLSLLELLGFLFLLMKNVIEGCFK